jgi:hypothetical protein
MSTDSFIQQIKNQIDLHLEATPDAPAMVEEAFVVSLYGEWGIGKTHTLKSLQAKYDEALHGALAQAAGVKTITIPVFFSPWRYEKEAHLIVPLVKTVQAQLDRLIADKVLQDPTKKSWLTRLSNAATSVANLGLSLAAGSKFKVSLLGIMEGEVDLDKVLKHDKLTHAEIKEASEKVLAKRLPPKAESLYYDTLAWLAKLCEGDSKNGTEPALRFVLFIDDLDRCLPDKAVEMLESIKLFLDIPAFAFVIGVDNEVIERGIRHRYDQYLKIDSHNLPITGNEYLEKIVHLPLVLPRMREDQARVLLEPYRARLAACLPLRKPKEGEQIATDTDRVTAVFNLLVTIVPPVPRKLIRAMEGLLFKLGLLKGEHPEHEKLSETFVLRLVGLQQLYPSVYRLIKIEPRNWLRLLTVRSERGVLSIEDEVENGKFLTLPQIESSIKHVETAQIEVIDESPLSEPEQSMGQLRSNGKSVDGSVTFSQLNAILQALTSAELQRGANNPLSVLKPLDGEDLKTHWEHRLVYMHHGAIAQEENELVEIIYTADETSVDALEESHERLPDKVYARIVATAWWQKLKRSLLATERSERELAMLDVDFSTISIPQINTLLLQSYFDPTAAAYQQTLQDDDWWDEFQERMNACSSDVHTYWIETMKARIKKYRLVSPRYQLEDDSDPSKAKEVRDLKTDLVWRRAEEAQKFTFDDAQIHEAQVATETGKAWRVPTKDELAGLVEKAKFNRSQKLATIDHAAFPDTPASWFWSSLSDVGHFDGAWVVGFGYGGVSNVNRSSNSYVRLVR